MKSIYCASRASIPARVSMWRDLKREGWPIISSWISRPISSNPDSMAELWQDIQTEIAVCDGVVAYAEIGDFPLKGVLVEIGMALGRGKPVILVGDGWGSASWLHHPMVYRLGSMPKQHDVSEIFARRLNGSRASAEMERKPDSRYVIVRTYSAGVFAGDLVSRIGREVVLNNAIRIWKWSGAASLSELAVRGVAKPEECKFPCAVSRVALLEAIEILDVSAEAEASIKGVHEWSVH